MKNDPVKEKRIRSIGLGVQFVVSVAALILAIMSFFRDGLLLYVEILIALDFFVMAFNNKMIYKRKNYTILYVLAGIVVTAIILYNVFF